MLYQKLLPASAPYVIYVVSKSGAFPMHKHYEIELIYSPKNSNLKLTVGETDYIVDAETLSIVGSLVPHSTSKLDEDTDIMILELGPAFLKKHFSRLSNLDLRDPLINLKNQNEETKDLKNCLEEIYSAYIGSATDELLIVSNIYRICANLVKLKSSEEQKKNRIIYKKLEKALDICMITEKKLTITGRDDGCTCEDFGNYVMETLKTLN